MQLPLEYHAEVLGDYARQQAGWLRLLALAIAAAIGSFFLLQAAYGSWRLALLSFLTLPAALVGGLLAALATGVIALGTLAGLLAVFGIAARGQIVLIRHYRQLIRYEGEPFGVGLALRGARERLSPTVITTLAIGLLLLSMLVALTITPALCLLLLAKAPIERREPLLVRWLQGIYAAVLTRIIQRPLPVFVATAAIIAVGLAVFPLLGESLFPEFKERDFLIH